MGSSLRSAVLEVAGGRQRGLLPLRPETMRVVMLAAFFIVIANLITDILYAVIDPRVRL